MPPRERPQRRSRRWLAITLAVAVHAVFIGVLFFSMRWQNQPPAAVTAELYAPPPKQPVVEPPPPKAPEPRLEPKPEPPKPAPKPPPKPEPPKPEPPKPEPPKVQKPDPRAAEIALKAKQEEERRKREEAAKKEAEKKRLEAEKQRLEAEKREEQRKLAEARERRTREAEALKAQADRERQEIERERERQAEAQARERARAEAEARRAAELSRAQADYISRIQQKIRGNVNLPPELAGNPEAIFDVVQLPTGEVIDVTLRKSSGVRAYDDAVQRAILKSSPLPLPRPDHPEVFQRVLNLKFRPRD